MRIRETGLLNRGESDGRRAMSTFPAIAPLPDGSVLATYRVGTTKDSDDGTIELRRSGDGGRSWSEPVTPFETTVNGIRGSLRVAYITPLADERLIAAALWVDRETHPGCPLFNAETEGCLPMSILIADSFDLGESWTGWRVLPVPDEIGPPSLTNPILRLPSGRLAVSIESNKTYNDRSQWLQRVVYVYSSNSGQTWSPAETVCQDPSGRIFNWDQRAAVATDDRLASFSWTYDRKTASYRNVHRRISRDEGNTWTEPEDLGFADQPSYPAILSDGRVVLAWVDRFGTRSIRARLAAAIDAPFLPETEVTLYEVSTSNADPDSGGGNTGELLNEMLIWNFGLPFADALPDGDVLVVYYAGSSKSMDICWTHLAP